MAGGTQQLSAALARSLAQSFHDIASAIGDYRIQYAGDLSAEDQYKLQAVQAQCLQYSNQFIGMGLFAQQKDLDVTLRQIAESTEKAKAAIKKIAVVDKVLTIATAAAVLGASIASLNPSAVSTGIQGLVTAIAAKSGQADSADNKAQSAGATR